MACAPSAAWAQTFEFERTLTPAEAARLEVHTERGRITVTAGAGTDVVVRGRSVVRTGFNVPADGIARARAVAAQPPVTQTESVIRLDRPADDETRRAVIVHYDVTVPAGMDVTTVTDSGETEITGTRAALSITTQSAKIIVTDIGGETRINTGSGSVTVTRTTAPLSVTTSSSEIRGDELGADLFVRTGSGRVTASFVAPASADIETSSSSITLDGLEGGLSATTSSGQVEVTGTPVDAWMVSSGSGRIRANVTLGSAFTLDVSSGSGSVSTDNMMVEGQHDTRAVAGDVNGGGPVVHLQSRSGSITIGSRGTS